MNKLTTTLIVVAIVVGLVGCFTGGDIVKKTKYVEEGTGAVAGPNIPYDVEIGGTLTQGGPTHSTSSTAATYTLTSEALLGHGTVEWTPNVDTTLTFMASSSFPGIPNAGDSRVVYWQNASSTAASSITFAAGTGIDIQYADGGNLVLNGLDWGKLTFIRQNDSDVTVIFDEMVEGD